MAWALDSCFEERTVVPVGAVRTMTQNFFSAHSQNLGMLQLLETIALIRSLIGSLRSNKERSVQNLRTSQVVRQN